MSARPWLRAGHRALGWARRCSPRRGYWAPAAPKPHASKSCIELCMFPLPSIRLRISRTREGRGLSTMLRSIRGDWWQRFRRCGFVGRQGPRSQNPWGDDIAGDRLNSGVATFPASLFSEPEEQQRLLALKRGICEEAGSATTGAPRRGELWNEASLAAAGEMGDGRTHLLTRVSTASGAVTARHQAANSSTPQALPGKDHQKIGD